jgi:hypothetical protein
MFGGGETASTITMEIDGLHGTLKSIPVRSYIDSSSTLFLFSLTLKAPIFPIMPELIWIIFAAVQQS